MSDPASKLALARRLAAMSLGVDELPPDAEVEMSIDSTGTHHVSVSVLAAGTVANVETVVHVGQETGRTCSRQPNPHPKCSPECPNDMHGSFCSLPPGHLGVCKH